MLVAEDGDGNPVSDLKKEDFTLRDQGEAQKVSFFAQQNTPAAQLHVIGHRPGLAGDLLLESCREQPFRREQRNHSAFRRAQYAI